MKNKLRFLGIIAIAAMIGFSMTACDDGSKPKPEIEVEKQPVTYEISGFNITDECDHVQHAGDPDCHAQVYNHMDDVSREAFSLASTTYKINGVSIETKDWNLGIGGYTPATSLCSWYGCTHDENLFTDAYVKALEDSFTKPTAEASFFHSNNIINKAVVGSADNRYKYEAVYRTIFPDGTVDEKRERIWPHYSLKGREEARQAYIGAFVGAHPEITRPKVLIMGDLYDLTLGFPYDFEYDFER